MYTIIRVAPRSPPLRKAQQGVPGPWTPLAARRRGGRQVVLVLTPYLAGGIELQLEKLCLNTVYSLLNLE